MFKENKKILLVAALILVGLVFVSSAVTYAYLTSNDGIDNKFTIGDNKIKLNEEFDNPDDIDPGDTIKKKVWATNEGNVETYVRAKILFSSSDMKKNVEALDLGNNWVYNSTDNYYYYTEVVKPGEDTTPLINQVKIKDSASQADLKSFDITIYFESTTDKKANNYEDAWR